MCLDVFDFIQEPLDTERVALGKKFRGRAPVLFGESAMSLLSLPSLIQPMNDIYAEQADEDLPQRG